MSGRGGVEQRGRSGSAAARALATARHGSPTAAGASDGRPTAHAGGAGGGEEAGSSVGAAAHGRDPQAAAVEQRRRRRAASTLGPRRWRSPAPASTLGRERRRRTADAARASSTVRLWWLTPWWRGRGSPLGARAAHAIGRPPSAGGGVERRRRPRAPVVPSRVPVPTTPGPMATTTTSASSAWRARASADGTLTASRSPPKAWPAVTVPSSRPALAQLGDEVAESASGSAAPSVIT